MSPFIIGTLVIDSGIGNLVNNYGKESDVLQARCLYFFCLSWRTSKKAFLSELVYAVFTDFIVCASKFVYRDTGIVNLVKKYGKESDVLQARYLVLTKLGKTFS